MKDFFINMEIIVNNALEISRKGESYSISTKPVFIFNCYEEAEGKDLFIEIASEFCTIMVFRNYNIHVGYYPFCPPSIAAIFQLSLLTELSKSKIKEEIKSIMVRELFIYDVYTMEGEIEITEKDTKIDNSESKIIYGKEAIGYFYKELLIKMLKEFEESQQYNNILNVLEDDRFYKC